MRYTISREIEDAWEVIGKAGSLAKAQEQAAKYESKHPEYTGEDKKYLLLAPS